MSAGFHSWPGRDLRAHLRKSPLMYPVFCDSQALVLGLDNFCRCVVPGSGASQVFKQQKLLPKYIAISFFFFACE